MADTLVPQRSRASMPTARARVQLRATTPTSYRWWKHVLLIAVFVAAGLVVSVVPLESVPASSYAFFIAALVFLNFGEYASHRWSMHVLRIPRPIHYRHVVEHHAFFTHEAMAVDDIADLRWVLFPPWALPLLVVSILPFFLFLWLVGPAGWAWLYLAAVVFYYGIYEVLHALAHLPTDHLVGGSWVVQALTHHHRVHHDPVLMDRYNFNFAIRLFDWLFGTTWSAPGSRA